MAKSIAVSGKGGTGKTTIAALLITRLCRLGQTPVLAIDADPDSNLAPLLGLNSRKSIGDLREEILQEIKNFPPGMSKPQYVEAGLHQIIEEADGFDLITMGRGEGAGCYCSLNNMIRKFSDDLTPSYSWVVIDNEAGLEHISRRTTSNIDALLIVVSDNPLSLHSAKKIEEITDSLDTRIKNRYLVANMVQDHRLPVIHDRLSDIGIELLCDIPFDPELEELIYKGETVKELNNSPILDHIDEIINKVGGLNANS
ncbi:MAG: hypothetical protein DRP87_02065 [Spirochaetes bacterium]|nr:MAG: hypothetical protein DRP87_02065 [Spirochaetota bacterium]